MDAQHNSDNPDTFPDLFKDLDTLPEIRPELAESIFIQTRGVLSRRRWMRRGRVVLACLVCYGVGMGSGWLLKPAAAPQVAGQPDRTNPVVPMTQVQPDQAITPAMRDLDSQKPATDSITTNSTPGAAKATVVRAHGSQFENFRRAGDRQLYERGNIRSAMDCYRRALTHATNQELRVEIDRDSWLLMSLKQSRLEDRKHVRQKRV